MHSKGKIIPQNPLFMRTSGIILFIQRQIQAERTEITLLPRGNFQTLQGPQNGKLGSGMVRSPTQLKFIPTLNPSRKNGDYPLAEGNFQTLQGPQKCKLGSGMVFSTIRLKIIPTRQVKTRSKLFCIDRLIPFGFI